MAAQGAFGTMFWTEYRPVIKIGPKGALGSHEIRPIHSASSLGQSKDSFSPSSSKIHKPKQFEKKTAHFKFP